MRLHIGRKYSQAPGCSRPHSARPSKSCLARRFKRYRSSRDEETAFGFISFCPLRIEHHSLCSAMGIPHSTQTRHVWTDRCAW
jgi:hypothetical protein